MESQYRVVIRVPNRYPDHCFACGRFVKSETGTAILGGSVRNMPLGWQVMHNDCLHKTICFDTKFYLKLRSWQ
jgi:hypothetical protein